MNSLQPLGSLHGKLRSKWKVKAFLFGKRSPEKSAKPHMSMKTESFWMAVVEGRSESHSVLA